MAIRAKSKRLFILSGIIAGSLLPSLASANRPVVDLDTLSHPTGLRVPSAERAAAFEARLTRRETIPITSLGLSRINDQRQRRKLAPLTTPAPAGQTNPRGLTALDLQGAASAMWLAETGLQAQAETFASLPAAVDNSLLAAFPPIRSQVGGSCQSWATTYYTATYMNAMANGWDAKNGGDELRLSPRWTYNFINNGLDAGADDDSAFQLLLDHGAARWSEFYAGVNPVYTAWPTDPEIFRRAIKTRLREIGNLRQVSTATGLDNLKTYLANGYILEFSTYVYAWTGTSLVNDPGTSADDALVGEAVCYYVTPAHSGPHSMTIAGYNDDVWTDINNNDVVDPGEKGALKIANSWGPNWNNHGFIWLAYDALKSVSGVSGAPSSRAGAFMSDRVNWALARTAYQPQLMGKFTLRAAYRSDISLTFFRSEIIGSAPTTITPPICLGFLFNPSGADVGALGFDGDSYAADPGRAPAYTFYLDLSGLTPADTVPRWYVMNTRDRNSADAAHTAPVQALEFCLVDDKTAHTLAQAPQAPQSAEGTAFNLWAQAPEKVVWLLPATDRGQVKVSPNPWRADRHQAYPISFNLMVPGSRVKIFTSAGRLIRELDGGQGYATWDVKESSGEAARRGVYYFLIQDQQGNKTTGRLAIIR